tara:strand:- start:873 stop:1019 length:147 start_codon:yes stop_codon:yes gene_type:complete
MGAIKFSPGFLNQTVDSIAKDKLKIKILKYLFFTRRENKKLIKKDRKK